MKRILVINRRIIKSITPYLYIFALLILMVMGLEVSIGKELRIPMPSYAQKGGVLLVYLAAILLLSYTVDIFYRLQRGIYFAIKGGAKKKTLKDRIRQVENP